MIDKARKADIALATVAHNGDLRDLRTRITKVIYDNCNLPTYRCGDLADAVIAELGLRKQAQTGEIVNIIEGDGINYGRHRYVTQWQPNERFAPYCNRCGIPHTTPCRRLDDA